MTVRSLWATLLLAIVVGGGTFFGSHYLPKTYSSTSVVIVSASDAKNLGDLSQGGTYLLDRSNSYLALGSSDSVINRVAVIAQASPYSSSIFGGSTQHDLTPTSMRAVLRPMLQVKVNPDTTVFVLTATAKAPNSARFLCHSFAESFQSEVQQLEQTGNSFEPVTVRIANDATDPAGASSPRPYVNGFLGVIIGLAVGFGFSLLKTRNIARN